MKNTTTFACQISTTDSSAAIGLEIWLNHNKIFNTEHVLGTENFHYEFTDNDSEHELRFIMKHKLPQHTTVNTLGEIVNDARLVINQLEFEEIELTQLFTDKAVYTHDFNGTQDEIEDQFFGEMGCNGTVSLKFTTPIYLWLLENM
jgi:hypothetical protein